MLIEETEKAVVESNPLADKLRARLAAVKELRLLRLVYREDLTRHIQKLTHELAICDGDVVALDSATHEITALLEGY